MIADTTTTTRSNWSHTSHHPIPATTRTSTASRLPHNRTELPQTACAAAPSGPAADSVRGTQGLRPPTRERMTRLEPGAHTSTTEPHGEIGSNVDPCSRARPLDG